MNKKLPVRSVADSMSLHGNIEPILEFISDNSEFFENTLSDHAKVLVNGVETLWLEYVPTCYKPEVPVPLIVCMHAGGQNRWGQFFDTAWHLVAEQENFIVIYPQATKSGAWNVSESGDIDTTSQDMQAILALIEDVKRRYSIDAGRIFMQGMSMGDLMSMQCGRAFGHILAGVGCCSGPTDPDLLFDEKGNVRENKGPVAVFQSRGVFDTISLNPKYPRPQTNVKNRQFWMDINGCDRLPLLRVTAQESLAYYPGEGADLCYRNMVRHGHYQAVHDAQQAWDLVFSKYRRDESGRLVKVSEAAFEADENAVALCDGSAWAYVNNKKVPLRGKTFVENDVQMGPPMGHPKPDEGPKRPEPGVDGPVMPEAPTMPMAAEGGEVSGTYVYVNVKDLEVLFGAAVTVDGDWAEIDCREKNIHVARGNTAALVNGKVVNMGMEAKACQGELCIPASWFAEEIMGWTCAINEGVAYIKNGPCAVTTDLANIVMEILE